MVPRPVFGIEKIDPDKVIEVIKTWCPWFDPARESIIMVPYDLVFAVMDLARMYNAEIVMRKAHKRSKYTFIKWTPQGGPHEELDDGDDVDLELTEKTDFDKVKEMIYEFVKQKKQCRVKDLKQHFDEKGIIVGQDKIRELLRQLHDEGKIRYSGIMIKLIEKDAT